MAASSTSFRKGQSGNPRGRLPGTKNRVTVALEDILEGEAKTITEKAIELAKGGDTVALRMCMDRLLPVRKDRPIRFALPSVDRVEDLTKATGALLSAVAAGELTPSEAAELARLVDSHVKAIEATDLHMRLSRLEEGRS